MRPSWIVFCLLGSLVNLGAQEQLNEDELFGNPDATAATTSPVETFKPEDLFTPTGIQITGDTKADLGAVLGLVKEEALGSPVFSFTSTLNLDSRPADYLRTFASVMVTFPSEELLLNPSVSLKEIFFDYTLGSTLFVRAGKYTTTWGVGRLFSPGDYLLGSGDGVSLKAFLPLGPNGLTFIALGHPGDFSDPKYPSPREMTYALQGETTLGLWTLGTKAYYQLQEGFKAGVNFRTSAAGFDLFTELLYQNKTLRFGDNDFQALAGFFWEGGNPKLRFQGEYWYNNNTIDYGDHNFAVGSILTGLPLGGWSPGVKWFHRFSDSADISGKLEVGFEGPVAPSLTSTWGLIWIYGSDTGKYVLENDDPKKRALLVGAKVNLAFKY